MKLPVLVNQKYSYTSEAMSDTLFDISQYQSQAHMSESPDLRDATGTDPAWEQPDHELDLGANSQRPVDDAITQWRSGAQYCSNGSQ